MLSTVVNVLNANINKVIFLCSKTFRVHLRSHICKQTNLRVYHDNDMYHGGETYIV